MTTVLCAVSFSPASEHAVRAAAALATRLRNRLSLVHVVQAEVRRLMGDGPQRMAEEALDRLAVPLRAGGVEVACHVLTGEPGPRLLAFAAECGAVLTVVGGASPEDGHVSVMDALMQRSDVPVIAVRDGEKLERWCRDGVRLRVMLGMDRSVSTAAARAWLSQLAEIGPLAVVAGHVYWPPAEFQRFGVTQPLMFSEPDEQLERLLVAELKGYAGVMPDGRPPEVALRIGAGGIAEHLVALAEEAKADLLLMGTHHRRGLSRLWSASNRAARIAPMSVAHVPAALVPKGSDAELPALMDVLAATDFTPSGDRAVTYASRLVGAGGTVHLVHVRPTPPGEEEETRVRTDLLARIPRQASKACVHFEAHVVDGEPAEAIAQLAERLNADAICVGTHGRAAVVRAFVGSVARHVMARSRRPVMVVPPLPE